jgi:sigma-B regulation protein RsbU (phosphoserine phosphatase)
MQKSPLRDLRDWLTVKGWYPRTLTGKLTVYIGLLDLALWLVHRGVKLAHPESDFAGGWVVFLTIVLSGFALVWLFQWVRRVMLWRLRNRLLVTYIFIGVFPVVLLVLMFVVAGGIFAGQFATYLATDELHMELHRLSSANHTLMGEAKGLARAGKLEQSANTLVDSETAERQFPRRRVSLWYRGKGYLLQGTATDTPLPVPEHAKDGFTAMVVGDGRVFLRAVARQQVGKDELVICSSVPMSKELMTRMVEQLGAVHLYPPDSPKAANETKRQASTKVRIQDGRQQQSYVTLDEDDKGGGGVSAGTVPQAVNFFDWLPPFPTVPNFQHWEDGKSEHGLMLVQTRPSQLYSRLFEAMGKDASLAVVILEVIAALLFIIELIALFIGFRLTRTITRSVAELYGATQHIEKGNFHHRIEIRSKDQLAALEGSFNSMTASIEGLIAEQKEKQKLESELAIAQEVQALLFPQEVNQTESLEMHRPCRRRHQRQRNFRCPAHGHGARVRPCVHHGRSSHRSDHRDGRRRDADDALASRRTSSAGDSAGPAQRTALSQHARFEIRDHVSRLLRWRPPPPQLFQRGAPASLPGFAGRKLSQAWRWRNGGGSIRWNPLRK